MPLIRTLIIDDEPAIRRDLQRLLSRNKDFIEIGACGSVAEGLVLIKSTNPDLVLLDIQLSDGVSFDLLSQLGEISFKVIFITAYNDGAMQAIKAGALDYLLKPVDEAEFNLALDKAKALAPGQSSTEHAAQLSVAKESYSLSDAPQKRIVLRTQQYLELIDLTEIIYAESDAGYTSFHLANGKKIVTSKTLKEYESLLPESLFIRAHQSFLVQKSYVARYHKEDGILILKDNTSIPVASRRREAVIESLMQS